MILGLLLFISQFGFAQSSWLTPIERGTALTQATEGQHPWLVKEFLNHWFSWDPQDLLTPLSKSCSKTRLQTELKKTTTDQAWNRVFAEYMQSCEVEAVQSYGPTWMGTIRLFAMDYPLDSSPFMKRMLITLPNGQKLKAVLALKDQKKRPFVVFRMGITGNTEEAFAERFFYYHLFERGFSHFLMIENMTSSDFIHNNQTLEFGGQFEAYQNIWLAQKLRDPQESLSKLIESLHLVGVSLGGHGVLTAAWLQPAQKNPHLYQSFLGLCPLVNLRDTYKNLFTDSWLRFPLELWAHSRFAPVHAFRPQLMSWKPGLMNRLVDLSALQFEKPSAEKFQVIEPEFMKSITDFYALHQLTNWSPLLRAPVRVWVTREDAIVPIRLNALELPGSQPLVIDQGQHCSFPVELHPHVTQSLFNAHLLQNSNMQWDQFLIQLDSNGVEDWQFKDVRITEKNHAILTLVSVLARSEQTVEVKPEVLDFQLSPLVTELERRALKRWFSTYLDVRYDQESRMTVSFPFVKQE